MRRVGLILAGGLALGAYQAGALGVLLGGGLEVAAVAGSSIGAFNGAIIAGNPPERRGEKLAAFWDALAQDNASEWLDPVGFLAHGPIRAAQNWLSAAGARLTGAPPLYRPRAPFDMHPSGVQSLYDQRSAAPTIASFADFDRINAAMVRFCCAAIDVETGMLSIFDTAAGTRIVPDHVVASGSLIPSFAPTVIDGRLYADGGLMANAPLEPLLATDAPGEPLDLYILVDLFAPESAKPVSLTRGNERASDLQFAGQTLRALAGLRREHAMAARAGVGRPIDLVHLAYPRLPDEAGPEKTYDFSRPTLTDRRALGARDAQKILDLISRLEPGEPGLRVHRV